MNAPLRPREAALHRVVVDLGVPVVDERIQRSPSVQRVLNRAGKR